MDNDIRIDRYPFGARDMDSYGHVETKSQPQPDEKEKDCHCTSREGVGDGFVCRTCGKKLL